MLPRNRGNGLGPRIAVQQGGAHQVQSPQAEIGRRTHAQKLGAAQAQRAFRHADRRRQLGHRQSPVALRGQDILEPGHDLGVALARGCTVASLLAGKAVDERMNEALLERMGDLTMHQYVRPGAGKTARLRVQSQDVGHRRPRWPQEPGRLRQRQRCAQQRLPIGGQIVPRQRDQAPAAAPDGALVNVIAAAMQHELAASHRHAVPDDGGSLLKGNETNTDTGVNERKAARGLASSTRARRRRRRLTQVRRALNGPAPVTTRSMVAPGTFTP